MKRLLYTTDLTLKVEGFERVEELPEDLERALVLVDIDTVGFSSLPDLKEGGNIAVAITSKRIPGYAIKLASLGFYDVLLKPVDKKSLGNLLKRLNGFQRVERVISLPERQEEFPEELCKELCSIVGNPEGKMKEVLIRVGKLASLNVPVLFLGETGVGKEVFAKALWKVSVRRNGPFVAVNCSAIPSELLEAELFGYEKGAFTGAVSSKEGLVELAKGGVLFLDEIGDLPLHLQPKLLRVLQEKKVRRLGSTKEIHCDFRLISSTNRDLKRLVKEGKFREDLYYRISAAEVYIPPLRERKEDIPFLVDCILRNISAESNKKIVGYTEGFLKRLLTYPWPGNVRELENALIRAVSNCTGDILKEEDLDIFPKDQANHQRISIEDLIREEVRRLVEEGKTNLYYTIMDKLSKIVAHEVFSLMEGNYSKASKVLGINRLTLRKILRSLTQYNFTHGEGTHTWWSKGQNKQPCRN